MLVSRLRFDNVSALLLRRRTLRCQVILTRTIWLTANGITMAAAFDAGLDFTAKHGTIEAVSPSAEKQLYQVFAEVSFTDGDGFRGVAAEPALADFLATDRSGTFYFYNALGQGALLAADIYDLGWQFSDPKVWYTALNQKIVWLLAFLATTITLVIVAVTLALWLAWLAAAAFAILAASHLWPVLRLARIAAAAERIRRSLQPAKQPGPRQRATNTGRFDNSLRLAM